MFIGCQGMWGAWGGGVVVKHGAVYWESYDNSRLDAILFHKKRMGERGVPD